MSIVNTTDSDIEFYFGRDLEYIYKKYNIITSFVIMHSTAVPFTFNSNFFTLNYNNSLALISVQCSV